MLKHVGGLQNAMSAQLEREGVCVPSHQAGRMRPGTHHHWPSLSCVVGSALSKLKVSCFDCCSMVLELLVCRLRCIEHALDSWCHLSKGDPALLLSLYRLIFLLYYTNSVPEQCLSRSPLIEGFRLPREAVVLMG